MLEQCRVKLAMEPPEVRALVELKRGDMTGFELEKRFALATLPFRPFQHLLTVEDQLACLTTIHRHLEGRMEKAAEEKTAGETPVEGGAFFA
jgi:hypothetical protein